VDELCAEYAPKIERNLNESILRFWLEKSLDRERGGYVISFDEKGQLVHPITKGIVTQARNLWLFSRTNHLDAARLGFDFITAKLWDATHGGFFWEVDESGDEVLRGGKHLYGQAFGIYGLTEYHRATGDSRALAMALECFRRMDRVAHDPSRGGYIESFQRDWSPLPTGEQSYMGCDATFKTMNTHMHLMEAFTALWRASGDPLVRERLSELVEVVTRRVVWREAGACTDKHELDWRPKPGPQYARIVYGHDLESIWLVMDACDALSISPEPYTKHFTTLFATAMHRGYDYAVGGFFYSGPLHEPADRRDKVWWVQAEACVSALRMFELTGDARYLGVFKHTYDFIENQMLDRTHGEWHARIRPDGSSCGAKSDIWRAGYHNGRAMLECHKWIQRMAAKGGS